MSLTEKRYEVKCLMVHEELAMKRLKKLYKDGWEIAGDILIKNQTGHCLDNYFMIPMKRKLKNNDICKIKSKSNF